MVPDDLRYTADHEWVRQAPDAWRVGITDFAQDALGDVVYVRLPEVGASVLHGGPLGQVESTKSISDLYSPVSGRVTEVNVALDARPELVNSDPYGEGWICIIEPGDGAASSPLLDAAAYEGLLS